jgi:hypothetical protein
MGYCNQWCEVIPDSMCQSQGPFVALLPQLEQQPVYNAFNSERLIYLSPNTTIFTIGVNILWCPSDPTIQQPESADLSDNIRLAIRPAASRRSRRR